MLASFLLTHKYKGTYFNSYYILYFSRYLANDKNEHKSKRK